MKLNLMSLKSMLLFYIMYQISRILFPLPNSLCFFPIFISKHPSPYPSNYRLPRNAARNIYGIGS